MRLIVLFAAVAVFSLHAQGRAPEPRRMERVPDKDWVPKVGDEVELYNEGHGVPIATNYLFYSELIKLLKAKDVDGLEKMRESGEGGLIDDGARIRILEIHDNEFLASHKVIEARLLDGPNKGNKIYVGEMFVARMIERPVPTPEEVEAERKAKEAERKAEEMEARARHDKPRIDALFRQGQSLERKRSFKAALIAYRKIVKEYPGTTAAKAASERIAKVEALLK